MSTPEDKTPIIKNPVIGKPVIKKTSAAQPARPQQSSTSVSPSDVGPLTGLLASLPVATPEPTDPVAVADTVTGTGAAAPQASTSAGSFPEGSSVDQYGVPLGPDGQPLSRRQLREWRRHQEAAATGGAGTAAAGERTGEPVTRESLAAEAAALAAKIQASGGDDPTRVDAALLREQEVLAEKARLLNTGLISQVTPATQAGAPGTSGPAEGPLDGAGSTASSGPDAPSAVHEPIEAKSAHGLDPLEASAWSARDRSWMIVAGIVFLLLVVALILAIVF
jgi:hypothetical protein